MTGTQFYQHVRTMSVAQREAAVLAQVRAGNVPDFLRALVPVTATASINGQTRTVTYHVTPDYVAVGSDADFFRMPMSAPLAQQIADLCRCVLPTRKMVDRIYGAAAVKLAPYPFNPANYTITSVDVFWLSNQAIEEQRAGQPLGLLVGGIKKDIVVTPLLYQQSTPRVALYGWHQLNGTPIQPLYLGHSEMYMDYSHGVRLVHGIASLDGVECSVPTLWASGLLSTLVSDEGAFTRWRYPNPALANLVLNPGFETNPANGVAANWTAWRATGPGGEGWYVGSAAQPSAAITYGRASLNKVGGSYSQYWARNDTVPFDGGVYQRFAVEPGATYLVTAFFKRQSTLAGTFLQVGADPLGGTNGRAASVRYRELVAFDNNDTFVFSWDTIVAEGPQMTLFARGGHSGTTGGANAYFYLDDVTVAKVAGP